jgi:hypothetical protein
MLDTELSMAQAGPVPEDQIRVSPAGSGGEDEFLDSGRSLAPRWLRPSARERPPSKWWRLGYALVAVAVGIAVIHQVSESGGRPSANALPSAAQSPAVLSSVAAANLAKSAALPGPVAAVRGLAARPANPIDLVRQNAPLGQCAVVVPGQSPLTSVLRTARSIVGPVTLIDAQRTLDGGTGLCALTIRASQPHVVITMSVASPGPHPGRVVASVRTGVAGSGMRVTEYAAAHTTSGWDVLIGAIGPRALLPGRDQLINLAMAAGVTW